MGALFFITTNQCFSTVSAAEVFIIERKLFVYVTSRWWPYVVHLEGAWITWVLVCVCVCVTGTSTSAATTGCRSTSWLESYLTSPCGPSPRSSSALLFTFWSVLMAFFYKLTLFCITEVELNAACVFLLRSQMHRLSFFCLHADGDSGGLHRHGHDHGHLSWPERRGSRQHLHDHHVRLHDGESRGKKNKKTSISLRFFLLSWCQTQLWKK